jgi:hypothetical protein
MNCCVFQRGRSLFAASLFRKVLSRSPIASVKTLKLALWSTHIDLFATISIEYASICLYTIVCFSCYSQSLIIVLQKQTVSLPKFSVLSLYAYPVSWWLQNPPFFNHISWLPCFPVRILEHYMRTMRFHPSNFANGKHVTALQTFEKRE